MKVLIEARRIGDEALEITWEEGLVQRISSEVLRKNCPSAISRAQRGDDSHEKPLTAKSSLLKIIEHTRAEELRLDKIWGVGNYALGMQWGDGHNTGIYTYDLLYELGSQG